MSALCQEAEGFPTVSTPSHARHNGVSGVAVLVETIWAAQVVTQITYDAPLSSYVPDNEMHPLEEGEKLW